MATQVIDFYYHITDISMEMLLSIPRAQWTRYNIQCTLYTLQFKYRLVIWWWCACYYPRNGYRKTYCDDKMYT